MDSIPRIYPCNTCSIKFKTSELQRSHMRQPWHIYNLRRRVAKLPAVSKEEYDTQVKSQEPIHQQTDNDRQQQRRSSPDNVEVEPSSTTEDIIEAEPEVSIKVPPTQCLFCNLDSPTLNTNMDHMASIHGLFIPSPHQLSNTESFLGYLATIVFEYNECLYCGLEKGTVDGVQTHMRDKGHCMIQMNASSELLDFWDFSDSESESQNDNAEQTKNATVRLSETEMRLPSGQVINSRSNTTQLRATPRLAQAKTKSSQQRLRRAEERAITAAAEDPKTGGENESRPPRSTDNRVALRSEMGLVGVSESQRRALQVTEQKMKKREALAKAAYRHAMERQPVKTKYYKTEAPIYQAG